MDSEPCAYWFTEASFAAAPSLLRKMKVKKLTALIEGSKPVEPTEDGLGSVMMADLLNTLEQLGVNFPEHGLIGNRGRGIPGVTWVTIDRELARQIEIQLKALTAKMSHAAIATFEPANIFVENATSAQRGIEYLQRALSIPNGYSGLIIRLN